MECVLSRHVLSIPRKAGAAQQGCQMRRCIVVLPEDQDGSIQGYSFLMPVRMSRTARQGTQDRTCLPKGRDPMTLVTAPQVFNRHVISKTATARKRLPSSSDDLGVRYEIEEDVELCGDFDRATLGV